MGPVLPFCLPFRNVGGLQLLCCQGFEVKYYDVTLDAWNLKPSDVCNVRVKPGPLQRPGNKLHAGAAPPTLFLRNAKGYV